MYFFNSCCDVLEGVGQEEELKIFIWKQHTCTWSTIISFNYFCMYLYQKKKTEEDYIFWGLIIKYYSLWDILLDSNLIDLLLEIRFWKLRSKWEHLTQDFFAIIVLNDWFLSLLFLEKAPKSREDYKGCLLITMVHSFMSPSKKCPRKLQIVLLHKQHCQANSVKLQPQWLNLTEISTFTKTSYIL